MKEGLLELIERYLDGHISMDELRTLSKEFEVTDLDKEIEWVKDARLAIETAGLRSDLRGIYSTENLIRSKAERTAAIRKLVPFILAASVLAFFVLLFLNPPSGKEDLYSKYEYVDPGLPLLMSESAQPQLMDAMTYYSEGNYLVSMEGLEEVRASAGERNDTVNYYLGACYLYSGDADGAIPYFIIVSLDQTSLYRQKAQWLLVLSHLRKGDLQQVRTLMAPIIGDNMHPFHRDALDLGSDLSE